MSIKEVKILILKKLDTDTQTEENISNLTKSDNTDSNYRNKNQNKLDNYNTSPKDINSNNDKKNAKEGINGNNKSLDISSNNKGRHKKVNLFFKGKELINDEEFIGNLVSNNGIEELELSVVILSLNDSSFVDENKTKEKLINKISNKCPYHKNNKELFICTTCNMAFCKHCSTKHKSHDIIERKDIIKFNNELKNLESELKKKLQDSNLSNIYEIKENKYNQSDNNIEKLQNRLDNIKKFHRGIINNYKREIDKSLPYLLEYKEKVEQLIENSYNLDTIQDDQQFIDYYYWYKNIKKKEEKINKEIKELEQIQIKFEETMNSFDEKIKKIYANIDQDYKSIKQLYYNNNIENENQFNVIKPSINDQLPKLNLFNLFNKSNNGNHSLLFSNKKPNKRHSQELKEVISNEKENDYQEQKTPLTSRQKEKINKFEKLNNVLSKSFKHNSIFSSRKKLSESFLFEKIEEKPEKEESLEDASLSSQKVNIKKIYNIKPNTQNIFYFDVKTRRIEEKRIIFNKLPFEAFQENQAILNYKNNLYLSGGFNLKIFYKYDILSNKFLKLKEMPTVHTSHAMIGLGNCIVTLGGDSSKKVEKYYMNENIWENMNDLNDIRIRPCCFGLNNKYLFVFGGLVKNENDKILYIEKIDISCSKNIFEKIKLYYKNEIILPKNCGFINLKDNQILIIGGKNSSNNQNKDENKNNCKIIIKNKVIEIEKEDKISLPKYDEFNGKTFNYLGEGLYGEFSSISHRTFYLINILTGIAEVINK